MSIIILRSDCISLNVSSGLHVLFLSLCSYLRAKDNPFQTTTKISDRLGTYLDFMLCNLIRLKIANYKTLEFTTTTHFCHMILCFKFGIKICHYYPCF